MDVAVAGRRVVGCDPEGDDLAGFRRRAGPGAQPGEFRIILEHMIGRQHRDHHRGIAPCCPSRRRPDCRRAVAPLRLEQDRRLGADLFQLLGDPETILEIGDCHRWFKYRPVADQSNHRLEGRPVPDQWNELLGQALARLRPDAGAGAPAHNHRLDLAHPTPHAQTAPTASGDVLREVLSRGNPDALRTPATSDAARTQVCRRRVPPARDEVTTTPPCPKRFGPAGIGDERGTVGLDRDEWLLFAEDVDPEIVTAAEHDVAQASSTSRTARSGARSSRLRHLSRTNINWPGRRKPGENRRVCRGVYALLFGGKLSERPLECSGRRQKLNVICFHIDDRDTNTSH